MSEPPAKKKKKSKSNDKRERIGWLEDKTLLYFRRASDQLKEGFEDDEDKSAFLDNVFKETEKEEIKLARNQTVSRILEEMIDAASKSHVESFLRGFTENYHLICTDRFASHVTQALIHKCAEILTSEVKKEVNGTDSESAPKPTSSFVNELFNVTYGNMREFVFDTYASHVIRSLLLLIGGCDVRDASLRSGLSQRDHNKRHHPQQQKRSPQSNDSLCLNDSLKAEYKPRLEQFSEQCLSLGVSDMAQSDVASPVLQAVLKALKSQKSSLADDACEKLVKECQPFEASEVDASAIPPSLTESAGFCRLVEELLAASSKTRLKSLYKHHLRGRLASLARSPSAPNFVLQRFLRSIRTPTLFALVMEEVLREMESFVVKSPQRAALVVVAEKCVEFKSHQREFLEALMTSLGCLTPMDRQRKLALLVGDFKTHDDLYGKDADNNNSSTLVQVNVSLQGSLLLQRLFSFDFPDAAFNSFMSLPPSQLSAFACNPAGCHVFDAIFAAPFLDDVKLHKFVSRMKSSLVSMATDKFGSRVVDALWDRAPLKTKTDVAETLFKHLGRLAGDRFGKFFPRKMQLENFKLKSDLWVQNMKALEAAKGKSMA